MRNKSLIYVVSLILIAGIASITYSCDMMNGIGEWIEETPSVSPEENLPEYISGEVSLSQIDNTFVADTSKVIYGVDGNPNNLIPSFSWYRDNQGDREWTAIPDVSTDTLPLINAYLDCNIRVEVKESTGTLKGAVYAEKVYTKTPELYISGEVSLTQIDNTFVADTSRVIYGADGNLIPGFSWYVDNKGDRDWTAIPDVSTDTLPLKDDYLDCNIRVEVTASPLKGAVYAQKVYPKTPELYISGEVFLTQIDNTFVADTSKVIYGADENPDNLIPSFTWYIDDEGNREWTVIEDASTGTLTLKDDYLDCNIRVEVKESTGTIKGAVYAEKVYTKTPELYISGEVSLTQVDNTFVANTSKVIYGVEGNPDNLIPSFIWYVDNQGNREWTAIENASTNTLTLKDDYLECNIRVEVKESTGTLKGAVYAEKVYTKLNISGEVSLTQETNTLTLTADTSGVINLDNPLNYKWYVEDNPWTVITGDTNTISVPDEYTGKLVRLEVTAPPLKGALYAYKMILKPVILSALADLKAPAILSEKIDGTEYYGTEPGGIAEALAWIDGQTPGTAGSIYAAGLGLNGKNGGQGWKMDGTEPRAADYPLAGRVFRINLEDDKELGPQTLGDSSGTNNYPNIKAPNADHKVNITIIGNPTANQGATSDWNDKVDLRLNAKGSLFKLADGSYISLTLDGALTLEGLTNGTHYNDSNTDPFYKISQAGKDGLHLKGLANDSMDNDSPLIYAGPTTALTMKDGVTLCGNTVDGGVLHGAGSAVAILGSYNGSSDTTDGAVFTMEGGLIAWNHSSTVGTVYMGDTAVNEGYKTSCKFIMEGGFVKDNYVTIWGGGVYASSGTTVKMSGNAEISSNTANDDGGGIYANDSTVTMSDDVKVSSNTTAQDGGGIYVTGTFTMEGNTKFSGNYAENGGAVYMDNGSSEVRFTMNGGEICNNTASQSDGGIYKASGIFKKFGGNVYGNFHNNTILHELCDGLEGRDAWELHDWNFDEDHSPQRWKP
ncbi:MAG: hypothetical protein LBM77_07445 [Spirochaetaceae bacterium]|jgi:predicted outer membrane repeat protein|nr:hypothetical protein [Spirochaetaceae bacterium]